MRFDGYFLLSDAIGIKNLQPRSLAVMKWRIREVLFNLGASCPEPWSPKARRWLVLYGVALTIYRLTLYIGIALMAYAILNKVLGVAVFIFEIAFFIVLPLFKETQVWWKLRTDIASKRRVWISGLAFAGLIVLLLVPFPQYFSVPARLSNGVSSEYFAPRNTLLVQSAAQRGQTVAGSEVLWQFTDPTIAFDIERLSAQVDAMDGRIQRLAASVQSRSQAPIFQREKERLLAELDTLQKRQLTHSIAAADAGVLMTLGSSESRHSHGPLALPASA